MKKFSLLARKEEKRNLRRAVLFSFLTLILGLVLIFLGIPALIKIAVFLGNLRASSVPIELKDNIPPVPPTFKPIPEATNSAEIPVSGFAEPGSTVKIFLTGEEEKEVVADVESGFTIDSLKLTMGRNEISAVAVDKAGNKSEESEKIIVWYDNEPPKLEISQPADKTTFYESEGVVEIKGTTESEITLTINDHMVIVDKDGNFRQQIALSLGENNITLVATDKAGNQTSKTLTLTYSP